jgi:hypothetical protein
MVVGSFPVEVVRIFNWPNPSSHTIVLGSTQPITEINTTNVPEGIEPQQSSLELIAITTELSWLY